MATRKYEQRLRAEAAAETRRRILDALYEQLRSAPSEAVGLDRIARTAGVSRSTVYTTFGSRSGLFDALGADLLHRGGFERMVREVLQPDAREGLRGGIRGNVEMYAAHRDVMRALYSMAALDAEAVGGAVQRMETGRAAGMDDLARRLGAQGELREDVTVAEAARRLWLFSAFDSFDLLYTGRSMTVEQVTSTLTTAAEHALCR
ncbi:MULTISPECIES: TetR/AcrR family transcriptional regulator [Streptomyces]|uniref:JadR n=1 Tax=Streptomyces venezuelae (strain ATCC 10712 / CBS 650.69 / DSM 40230 / JCM 4526 / NBRC 13096 / PD 04745) TaxID=953739 RepID=Q939Q2_STRVP|nr:TetR/AcrR family transcriptional regulator [Streptomyces venezuelae]AAL14255.1 JadR* [Streptomyces venezuelae ATCC 10712]APE24787.1 TetR family transcriptional regulator [Streptomyces venezuelae]QES02136.1 TetR/AcrR family transcriptional regulator [Streptomyces venezuelae ATCC 10712]QES09120.1 TetR/AcrR family transcriptional regulator [Streptomyces venezuelae]QES12227.1 TetR/AcrR family transcriptional regulator [Streptomyces venezuelae]